MNPAQINAWLHEQNPDAFEELYAMARRARTRYVGSRVHLRGRVDFSNLCRRQCTYCGIRAGNRHVVRYMMRSEEIMGCAARVQDKGYGTIVLQAGEDERIGADWMADLVGAIRDTYGLAIALSLGERSDSDYRLWREHGAERYLLKFETSDPVLYRRIHPPRAKGESDRIAILKNLRAMGYEIGSGIMVGLPGQSFASLVEDLLLFQELDLDMIAVGPYTPHPETPLARKFQSAKKKTPEQTPNSDIMTAKVLALARLLCPEANIPATSALYAISEQGLRLGLHAGANVIMPDMTPARYEALYDIYPKPHFSNPMALHTNITEIIAAAGLVPGSGTGARIKNHSSTVDWK